MLDDMEKTISMAQLARNTDRIADDIEAAGTVYRIKRPGRRPMLLIDHEYFESRLATIEFMQRHPNWRQELAEGRRQFDAGLYIPYAQIRKELGLAGSDRKTKRSSPTRRPTRGRKKSGR